MLLNGDCVHFAKKSNCFCKMETGLPGEQTAKHSTCKSKEECDIDLKDICSRNFCWVNVLKTSSLFYDEKFCFYF